MPKQEMNIVMRTTRGMLGGQVVFKERAGESYVSAPPEVDENRKGSTIKTTAKDLPGDERTLEVIL